MTRQASLEEITGAWKEYTGLIGHIGRGNVQTEWIRDLFLTFATDRNAVIIFAARCTRQIVIDQLRKRGKQRVDQRLRAVRCLLRASIRNGSWRR